MKSCIKCQGDIFEYKINDLTFLICKKCGAVIMSEYTFTKFAEILECPKINLFEIEGKSVNENTVNCINCNEEMSKIIYNGVILDRCSKCRQILFDNGELSKYFNKFSNFNCEIMNNALFLKTYCNRNNLTRKNGEKSMENNYQRDRIQSQEKEIVMVGINGFAMVFVIVIAALFSILLYFTPFTIVFAIIIDAICLFMLGGFITVKPQEAFVLTLFGKYVGTLKQAGFYWINPFISGKLFGEISLKARTLDNGKQKINDEQGNPIEVGIMVTWEVQDTAKATFNVDNYSAFLSAQCDSALRRIVRLYPYDTPENSDKESLRGDSAEISEKLKKEIQAQVYDAGLHIIDARITHLAYSPEIAAAMLQRQQANAIIDAKRAIVDGAVGMVEMALEKLSNNQNITLDEATKANMVNNLLVVLCGNKESQPVIRNDLK